MTWWRVGGIGALGLLGLACSGVLGPDPAAEQARLDASDPAERARLQGDFEGAEGILKDRLAKDPDDARSWRLLGDVNLTRGQTYQERWKENLGWAVDAYRSAVTKGPRDCVSWGRLAAAVVAASENPATQVPREALDALPLEIGRAACPGAALLVVDWHRRPDPGALAAAADRLDADPAGPEALAVAAPWIAESARALDLSGVPWQAWVPRPPLAAGVPFVVLEVPATGGSVEGSTPRRFTAAEWVTPKSVGKDRIVYLDRRFTATVPQEAVTRAPGCPGTTWELRAGRMPAGQCVAGPQDRRASELYDPEILRPADDDAAHFHQPSIRLAEIPWETVADKSVRCLGGPVGRLFVDTPSCRVAYDRAIPQTRWLPTSVGQTAWTVEHAENVVFAARAGKLLGDEVAAHLARGELGVGLPYTHFVLTQPELPGCKGRGVFQKLAIVDGALEFGCAIQGVRYRFRELVLVEVAAEG